MRFFLAAVTAALGLASLAFAADLAREIAFDIPAQPLAQALADFSRQSDVIVAAASQITAGKLSNAVNATTTAEKALKQLLQGSKLVYTQEKDGSIIVKEPVKISMQGADPPSSPKASASSSSSSSVPPQAEQTTSSYQNADLKKQVTLEEVVVTAEKRPSTVQKTPFSVTAITDEQLEARGLSSISEVAAATPGISMRTSGPGQTEYEMRGLPSLGGSSATVGFYLNDTPLSSPAAAGNGKVTIDPDLFDLARVEVLRGPQGTLYGASSMGGTIKLVTAPPELNTFDGAVQAASTDTSHGGLNWGASVMLNIPMIDNRLAVRLVGTNKFTDGWIDRIVQSPFPIGPGGACGFSSCTRGNVQAAPVAAIIPRSNWERLGGGRASVRFQPTEALSIDLLLMYQRLSMGGFNQVDDPLGVAALAHFQPFSISEPYKDTFRVYSLAINYDLGFARLTSASSKWLRESVWSGDQSEAIQNTLSTFFGFPPLVPVDYHNSDHSQQASQELRLTSTGEGRLQWIFGGYVANFTSIWAQLAANPAYTAISTGGAGANPTGILFQAYNPYHIRQYALFGEPSYRITDTIKATVGLRWFKYHSELDFEQTGAFTQTGNATPTSGAVQTTESGFNPKANLSYEPSPNLTIYTQVSRGFRPGGVNFPVPTPPCAANSPVNYQSDSIWNYELGEKALLFGGRLSVNADVYYIHWQNVQQLLFAACGFSYTTNAGTAESYGPEAEVTAQLTHDLSATISGTYTEAHVTRVNAADAGLGILSTQPLTPGLPLQNVPQYVVNAALNFAHPISPRYQLTISLEATRTGPLYDLDYYFTRLPAYTSVNARFGLLGKKVRAYLFAKNLFNEHAELAINTMEWAFPVPSFTRPSVNQPRTTGLEVYYAF